MVHLVTPGCLASPRLYAYTQLVTSTMHAPCGCLLCSVAHFHLILSSNWTTGALLVQRTLRTLGRFNGLHNDDLRLFYETQNIWKPSSAFPNLEEVKKSSRRRWQADIWEVTACQWIYLQTHKKYDSGAIQLTQGASYRSGCDVIHGKR